MLLTGCSRQPSPQPTQSKIVTGITVSWEENGTDARRYYTTSEKMRAVLNYLRWIDPYGTPQEDPEAVSGCRYRIILSYSDGREKQYLQKANRYLWEEGKSWRRIDPENAATLGKILSEMQSDIAR